MLFACIITILLAIALTSLRIFPLLFSIAAIALLYAAALTFNVVYIQSIGSGIGVHSELFTSYGSALLSLLSLFSVLEIQTSFLDYILSSPFLLQN